MNRRPIRRQRGAATLAVAMVLLFAMTIVAFFSQRALLFEQRTSANQYRAALAFEAAEAGLEWATAMLNDPRHIDAACRPQPGQPTSFRARYVPQSADGALLPLVALRPGCSLASGGPVCSCHVAGLPVGLPADTASFTVEFANVPGDPQSLRVTARGCTDAGSQCVQGSAHEADAAATTQALLKLRPLLRATPVAALTAGGDAPGMSCDQVQRSSKP